MIPCRNKLIWHKKAPIGRWRLLFCHELFHVYIGNHDVFILVRFEAGKFVFIVRIDEVLLIEEYGRQFMTTSSGIILAVLAVS